MYSLDGSTLHICRHGDELFCCVWRLDLAGWGRLALRLVGWCSWFRLKFRPTTTQVLINYFASSAQVPASHLLLIYSTTTTTRDHVFHVSSFPLVCWTDLFAGSLWCTVSQILLAQILTLRANWSYCFMRYVLCTLRMRYRFAFLLDSMELCCDVCYVELYELYMASGVNTFGGWGHLNPRIPQGMTWECHRLGRGVVTKLYGFLP